MFALQDFWREKRERHLEMCNFGRERSFSPWTSYFIITFFLPVLDLQTKLCMTKFPHWASKKKRKKKPKPQKVVNHAHHGMGWLGGIYIESLFLPSSFLPFPHLLRLIPAKVQSPTHQSLPDPYITRFEKKNFSFPPLARMSRIP